MLRGCRPSAVAALQSLHEGFGRNFSAALSALLRTVVEVKLASIEQVTYGDFVWTSAKSDLCQLVKASPPDANWILDVQSAICSTPMIDRLLGGGREPGLIALRPLTEIELRLDLAHYKIVLTTTRAKLAARWSSLRFVRRSRRMQSKIIALLAFPRTCRCVGIRSKNRRRARHR